jgi:hypothetical protein
MREEGPRARYVPLISGPWEHFLSCPFCPVQVSVPELIAMMSLMLWDEIANHACRVTRIWLNLFQDNELLMKSSDMADIFV